MTEGFPSSASSTTAERLALASRSWMSRIVNPSIMTTVVIYGLRLPDEAGSDNAKAARPDGFEQIREAIGVRCAASSVVIYGLRLPDEAGSENAKAARPDGLEQIREAIGVRCAASSWGHWAGRLRSAGACAAACDSGEWPPPARVPASRSAFRNGPAASS